MDFPGNVDHGPRNRSLNFGDVLVLVRTLTIDLQKLCKLELFVPI